MSAARPGERPSGPLGGKVAFLTVLGLLVLVGCAWVGVHLYAGDRAPRSARVEGISIAGMTQAQAEAALRRGLEEREQQPILVTYGDGRTREVRAADAGLAVDYGHSVEAAGGGTGWGVQRLWEVVSGGGNHRAEVTVDDQKMQAVLDDLSDGIGRRPVNGTIAFRDGRPAVVPGRAGVVVSRSMAEALLESRFLRVGSQKLPTEIQQPEISAAELRRALLEVGRPAMSGPVTLVLGGVRVVAPPRLFGRALSMTDDDGRLVLQVDGDLLLSALDPVMPTVGREPRDARIEVRRGRPVVVPARLGVSVEGSSVEAGFARAVVARGGARRVVVRGRTTQPSFTTADARALEVRQRVASYTTTLPGTAALDANLARAARLLDGTLLRPRQMFSFNGVVGERSKANGFTTVAAPEGGVSQLATTVFNAALLGGLTDRGHTAPSVHSSRLPAGREAVVSWPAGDLRFTNDTPYGVLVTAAVTPARGGRAGTLTVSLWSTRHWRVSLRTGPRTQVVAPAVRVERTRGCRPVTGVPGFTIDVDRFVRGLRSGKVLHHDRFHTDYAATGTVKCAKPPKRKRG